MPELTIRLRCNPETGKKEIIIDMTSDQDALPHEHEQQHRALAERIMNGKLSTSDKLEVERVEEKAPAGPAATPEQPQRQAQPQGR